MPQPKVTNAPRRWIDCMEINMCAVIAIAMQQTEKKEVKCTWSVSVKCLPAEISSHSTMNLTTSNLTFKLRTCCCMHACLPIRHTHILNTLTIHIYYTKIFLVLQRKWMNSADEWRNDRRKKKWFGTISFPWFGLAHDADDEKNTQKL